MPNDRIISKLNESRPYSSAAIFAFTLDFYSRVLRIGGVRLALCQDTLSKNAVGTIILVSRQPFLSVSGPIRPPFYHYITSFNTRRYMIYIIYPIICNSILSATLYLITLDANSHLYLF